MKLAAESQRRHLEATLANAKRDAAQATSAHKLAAATWQAECSTHEKEVSAACRQHDRTASPRYRSMFALLRLVACTEALGRWPTCLTHTSCDAQVQRIRGEVQRAEAERDRAREEAQR